MDVKHRYSVHMIWRCLCFLMSIILMPSQPARAADAQLETQAAANPVAAKSFDLLSATRERPLFNPERRLPTKAAVVVQETPSPPPMPVVAPQVSLLGVIDDPQGARAVVRSDPAGKLLRLRIGDEIGGWHVTEIEGQRLVMSLDERSIAVKLFASEREGRPAPIVHASDRVLEVNEAGILRSHRVHHAQ